MPPVDGWVSIGGIEIVFCSSKTFEQCSKRKNFERFSVAKFGREIQSNVDRNFRLKFWVEILGRTLNRLSVEMLGRNLESKCWVKCLFKFWLIFWSKF